MATFKKLERRAKIFRGVMYFNIVVIILLFVFLGISWIQNSDYYNSGGAGAVMAIMYVGPIIVLNMVATIYYILVVLTLKNREAVAEQYYKCNIAYGAHVLLSIVAVAILWI